MKYTILGLALFCYAFIGFAEESPKLSFNGYIVYPVRHEYRIDIYTYADGLISRIVTYSGEPLEKSQEAIVSNKGNGVSGSIEFQGYIKKFQFEKSRDRIRFTKGGEDLSTHKKMIENIVIKMNPSKGVLFEDAKNRYCPISKTEFRVFDILDKSHIVIFKNNQIFDDGWYRSDWKKEGNKTYIQEFTTMEIAGDWMDDGGGIFIGNSLNVDDLATNVINSFIMDNYVGRRIFLPFIFGLNTGGF